jgi:hypothetical protein
VVILHHTATKGLVTLSSVIVFQHLLAEEWTHRMSCAVKPKFSLFFMFFFGGGGMDSRKMS